MDGLKPRLAALLRRKWPAVHAYDIRDKFKKEQMLMVLEMNGVRARDSLGKLISLQ